MLNKVTIKEFKRSFLFESFLKLFIFSGPLWNNTDIATDSDILSLKGRFKLWHNPIPSLINNSPHIVKTEAISFKKVIEGRSLRKVKIKFDGSYQVD